MSRATAALVHRQELLDVAVTDADGRVRLRSSVQEGSDLWVAGVSWEPVRVRLRPGADDDVEVTLPAGEVVSGRVSIDGSPPRERIWFEMTPGIGLGGLPKPVKEHVTAHSMDSLFQPLGEDGSFLFIVPKGWTGTLSPTPPHSELLVIRGATLSYLEVEAGDVLELDYEYVPVIQGKAVLAGDAPLPRVRVSCTIDVPATLDIEPYTSHRSATTDVNGRFRIPVTLGIIESGPLTRKIRDLVQEAPSLVGDVVLMGVADQSPVGFGLRLRAVKLSEGLDLGEIVLGLPERIPFRVLDAGGLPVGGAVAKHGVGRAQRSTPTNGEGMSFVESFFDTASALILATGYEPVEVELATNRSVEDVVLQRAATLVVRTTPAAVVNLESAGGGLIRSTGLPNTGEWLIGSLVSHRRSESAGKIDTSFQLRATSGGELVITGVVPGVVHELRIVGAEGELGEVQRVVVQPGEHVRVDLGATGPDVEERDTGR